jgi:hypothetical protein
MFKEFGKSGKQQFVALFLCALFGLGIIGFGGRSESEEIDHASTYRGVFLPPDPPHRGQDRGDESDLINVNAPSIYTNTAAATLNYIYRPGSLTPIADPYGHEVYWLSLG